MNGTTLSHYRILEKLGAGGMGEVYRAEDTYLDRHVAVKVLPDVFSGDPERLARFEREAKLLASLNHPNIAAIYGLEQAEGKRFLVLELVEGETLAQRIAKGPLAVDEALDVCRQIAEGLEVAHEKGIIHRDLKPANVKITPEGTVKVLDFGLAKALADETAAGDAANSPTITAAMTRPGVVLGTAAYMSPEQARGAAADKRADIWAFGVILFEMLAGRPCFAGDSVTDVLAAIVKSEPDWAALPSGTSGRIRDLLHRCLAKDRKRRLRDIGDARLDIEATLASPVGAEAGHAPEITTAAASAAGFWPRRRTLVFAGATLVIGAAVAAAIIWQLRPARTAGIIHAAITLREGHALYSSPAISLDGRTVAFISGGPLERPRLYTRRLMEDFEVRPVPGAEDADCPFFSPDGRSIGFFAKGQLFRVNLDGGTPKPLAPASSHLSGTWGDDDSIVFTPTMNGGLFRVAAGGGKLELLIRPDGVSSYAFVHPRFLPGAGDLLFTAWGRDAGVERLKVVSRERTKGSARVLEQYRAGCLRAHPLRHRAEFPQE